uniref:Uncharacterized protein n=1 Tax=Sphaerodactylus townsendi TaxID=933632 RepID=A0ACB8F574_9SAUR
MEKHPCPMDDPKRGGGGLLREEEGGRRATAFAFIAHGGGGHGEEAGHYSLGDVAKRGSGQPLTWALMVKDEGNGLLKHPHGFRCIKESLLVQGKTELISSLTDELEARGIEADRAVTPDGLSAGTFVVVTNHHKHTESVYVLKEYRVMLKQHASLQPNRSEDGSPCKIVCYVTNWAQYRPKPAKFYPEDINPDLCTHISFAFASIRNNHLSCNEWNDEMALLPQIQALKKRNPALLTLLAVGGRRFGTAFSPMLSTAATRKSFIDSAIPMLRSYNFDGIDLHFEHPGCRGSPPKDKHRFTLLIEEMTKAFEKEARETGNKKLLLTVAVAAQKETIDAAYEVDKLSKHLDYISVMAYNFQDGLSDRVTSHHSPLYAGNDSEESLNCKFAMLYWIQKGAPAYKLLMGFANYGHTFKLSTKDTSVGAPASGPAHPGHYTHEAGLLSYYEDLASQSDRHSWMVQLTGRKGSLMPARGIGLAAPWVQSLPTLLLVRRVLDLSVAGQAVPWASTLPAPLLAAK